MSSAYYTAEEAIQKLSKPRSTFFREVEEGKIPFELEEGRLRGRRYPKEAIDILAQRERKIKQKNRGPVHLIFTPSTPADLWQEVQIGKEMYGEGDIVTYEKLLEWNDINDEMFMCVKDQGQVVAYSTLMPLEESVILPLLEDKIREQAIPGTAIRQWTDPRLSVLLVSLTVKPSGNARRDGVVGRYVLKSTLKWALAINRQCDVKNWYGIGATKDGQHLFERLGFNEIVSLYDGERKGYKLDHIVKPGNVLQKIVDDMDKRDEATR